MRERESEQGKPKHYSIWKKKWARVFHLSEKHHLYVFILFERKIRWSTIKVVALTIMVNSVLCFEKEEISSTFGIQEFSRKFKVI